MSLAGFGRNRNQVPPMEFIGTASGGGVNHVLFVSDTSRSWMNGPGLAEMLSDWSKALASITASLNPHSELPALSDDVPFPVRAVQSLLLLSECMQSDNGRMAATKFQQVGLRYRFFTIADVDIVLMREPKIFRGRMGQLKQAV